MSVCNFVQIINDVPVEIGDAPGIAPWQANFSTPGVIAEPAFLIFNVKGLTTAPAPANVLVNNVNVGVIFDYNGSNLNYWYTQLITIKGTNLSTAGNTIIISPVSLAIPVPGSLYDNYQIKNLVCFFHKA